MNDLIELVQLTSKTKLKIGGALKLIIEPGSKMEQLYEAVESSQVKSDEDARSLLGGTPEDVRNLPSLKNKLKDRLLDAIFLLDFKEASFSDRQRAFYECHKKWSAAMILLIRNAKINGIDVLEKLLRRTKHFEFTELNLDILRVLKLQYSTVDGDLKNYELAKAEYEGYEKLWIMESRAEHYYQDLMVRYTNSKSTKTEVADIARGYYAELEGYMAENASFKLHLFGRMIQLLIYNSANDYVNTARLCESAIAFFDQKEYDSGLPLQVFYYNLIVCYLQLREFEKGQEVIGRCEYYFEEGSFNWFKLQELFFLLAMHTGHYDDAYRLYYKVTHYPKFSDKPAQIREMWKIFQAYVYYLVKIGEVSEELLQQRESKFKINKFLNEITLFSKDKSGMNISVLVVQILHFIADRDYEETIERMDGINKYLVRYVKEDGTARSNLFIKMLLQIPLANFHREAALRKTERYRKQLQDLPLETANQSHEIEIIPFEALWEMTIGLLEAKIYTAKKRKVAS
ncbi:MAG TPA: hypothetical protein PKD78_04285 [Saprospiraceae bacterium]|nr:hypothetical protein [Saprospiraceae bacterium]HNG88672.1 hypothetical protein [Saprospiraceae bacterium]